MSILVNAEIAFVQAGHDALLIVDDGGMEQNFLDLLTENENSTIVGIPRLPAFGIRAFVRGGWRRAGSSR